jgi:hypothetical protein
VLGRWLRQRKARLRGERQLEALQSWSDGGHLGSLYRVAKGYAKAHDWDSVEECYEKACDWFNGEGPRLDW